MLQDVEIMRTGTFTASNGQDVTLGDSDLEHIASSYDPQYHEAPAVIGHPVDNGPAYGWVKSLKFASGKLMATLECVPEFVDMIRQGLFKKRSASIYPDMDRKGFYLRHVGFLGAMPPAIKGLKDIALSDDSDMLMIEFEEQEKKTMSWKDLFKKAVDEMPEPGQVQVIQTQPAATASVQFSEAEVEAKIKKAEETAAQKAREEAKLEFAEQQKQEAARLAKENHKTLVASTIEGLQQAGKVTPAMVKAGLQEFMECLGNQPDAVLEFSEGKKETPFQWCKGFLEGLPKAIEFGEVAGKDKDPGKGGASQKLAELVRQKMSQNPEMPYSLAFSEAQRENPDLAEQYRIEITA
jgi:hypothetical protein